MNDPEHSLKAGATNNWGAIKPVVKIGIWSSLSGAAL